MFAHAALHKDDGEVHVAGQEGGEHAEPQGKHLELDTQQGDLSGTGSEEAKTERMIILYMCMCTCVCEREASLWLINHYLIINNIVNF